MKRFCILYTRPGSYTRACLKALRDNYGVEIRAVHYKPYKETPYIRPMLDGVAEYKYRSEFSTSGDLVEWVMKSRPDCLFVCGWNDKGYLQAARILKKRGVLVVGSMDTQFSGSFRQRVACVISRHYLHSAFNSIWVPGERQRQFAKRLGFTGQQCWTGLYSCDVDSIRSASLKETARKRGFLFVGRYVRRKGLDVLMKGYAAYRARSSGAWELACIGSGDLNRILKGQPGVRDLGFAQPDELPSLLFQYGCFVLPSRFEAWGVAVHEAASAGMPLICSEAVGASVHLVREHYNGYTFRSEDAEELSFCLQMMAEQSDTQLETMSQNSRQLSSQYSPKLWADTLTNQIRQSL